MSRSQKAWIISALVAGGLLVALAYHAILGMVLRVGYPSNTFLFRPELVFSDFYDIFIPVQMGSPLSAKGAVYFPFAYIPLYPLLGMYPTNALRVTLLLFSIAVFYFFWCRLSFLPVFERGLASATISFATYPFLFCVNRANLEMIVLLFVLGFFVCFARGKHLLAGAFLACAIAMKLYPGVFGVLLLVRRQYKAAALTGVLTFALTIGAAALFPGGVPETARLLSENLGAFRQDYVLSSERIYFSASFFSVLKLVAGLAGENVRSFAEAALLPYTILSAILFALVVAYILRYERTFWKQVALLSFLAILLPEVSFDYKLIHLLIPVGLFIEAAPGGRKNDRLYALLLGLLLIPKAYAPIGSETTLGVLLNPFLMTLMAAHIMWTGLRSPRETGGGSAAFAS